MRWLLDRVCGNRAQDYMHASYCEKCQKKGKASQGDKWFATLMNTLLRGCGRNELTQAQAEQATSNSNAF